MKAQICKAHRPERKEALFQKIWKQVFGLRGKATL